MSMHAFLRAPNVCHQCHSIHLGFRGTYMHTKQAQGAVILVGAHVFGTSIVLHL